MIDPHAWIDYCRATLRGEHPPPPAPVYEVDDIGYQRPRREDMSDETEAERTLRLVLRMAAAFPQIAEAHQRNVDRLTTEHEESPAEAGPSR